MTGFTKQSRAGYDALDCFVASLLAMTENNLFRRREVMHLAGDVLGHRRSPGRAAAAFDVCFYPEHLPALGRADAVHGRRSLNAFRIGLVEKQHRPLSACDLLDLLPQQAAVQHDRLVALAEMLVG